VYPVELKYNDNSLWVKVEAGNRARAGITIFYSEQITRTIFIELCEAGITVKKGEPIGSLESSKSINDLESPVSGRIITVNSALNTDPGLTNTDPYGRGWLVLIEMERPEELDSFMAAGEYEAFVKKKLEQRR
jgi:glycine cleavage system H protein